MAKKTRTAPKTPATKSAPRSARFSAEVLAILDLYAVQTGWSVTDVLEHLIRLGAVHHETLTGDTSATSRKSKLAAALSASITAAAESKRFTKEIK
jgi:hypothetical protein